MLKKLALVAGLLFIVLAVACGGSDKESTNNDGDNGKATAVATDSPQATKAATKQASKGSGVKSAFEPLSLLTGPVFSGQNFDALGTEAPDPELEALLLASGDLPSGYMSVISFGNTVDSEQGPMTMATRMFVGGSIQSAEVGEMVMTAAIAASPEALAEFDSGINELDGLTVDDLKDLMGSSDMMGVTFKEFEVLDAAGVGDAAFGMHMVMDMGELAGSEGGMGAYADGIGFDMFISRHGDILLMTMVMWPSAQPSSLDALALLKVMDSRVP